VTHLWCDTPHHTLWIQNGYRRWPLVIITIVVAICSRVPSSLCLLLLFTLVRMHGVIIYHYDGHSFLESSHDQRHGWKSYCTPTTVCTTSRKERNTTQCWIVFGVVSMTPPPPSLVTFETDGRVTHNWIVNGSRRYHSFKMCPVAGWRRPSSSQRALSRMPHNRWLQYEKNGIIIRSQLSDGTVHSTQLIIHTKGLCMY